MRCDRALWRDYCKPPPQDIRLKKHWKTFQQGTGKQWKNYWKFQEAPSKPLETVENTENTGKLALKRGLENSSLKTTGNSKEKLENDWNITGKFNPPDSTIHWKALENYWKITSKTDYREDSSTTGTGKSRENSRNPGISRGF